MKLAPVSRRTYHLPMSLTWYFFLAVGFLILVILSVPDDKPATPDAPEASQSLLVPSGTLAGALPPTGRT